MVFPTLDKKNIEILFDGGRLCVLTPEDVHPGYVRGLNNPDVNRHLVSVSDAKQATLTTVTEYVKRSYSTPDDFLFGIWPNQDDHHCGTVRLHSNEKANGKAYIGLCIFDKDHWGRGLGSRVISPVTRWAFDELKLRWVEAGIFEENLASQKAFRKAGYKCRHEAKDKFLHVGIPSVVKVFVAENA